MSKKTTTRTSTARKSARKPALSHAQIWEAFRSLDRSNQQAIGTWIVLCAEAKAEAEAERQGR